MKTRKILWSALALICAGTALFTACEPDEKNPVNNEGSVSIDIGDKDTLVLEWGDGGENDHAVFTVESKGAWEYEDLPDWLEVSVESGNAGNTEVEISAKPLVVSDGVANRRGTIVVKSGENTATLEVRQPLKVTTPITYFLDPKRYVDATLAGGKKTFRVTCNVPWELAAKEDWIVLDKTAGKAGGHNIVVDISESNAERSGDIIFSAGTITAKLTVRQAVEPLKISLTAKRLTAPMVGQDKKFYMTCNYPWKITGKPDWVTVSPTEGGGSAVHTAITATVQPGGERTGDIIMSIEYEKKTNDGITTETVTRVIPVNQVNEANYYKDGDVIVLHTHSVDDSKAVPIVIAGDGWDLSDLKKDDGLWETWAKGVADLFKQTPVVKDLIEYFDIYALCSESNSRGKYGFNAYGTEPYVGGNFDKVRSNITKMLKDRGHAHYTGFAWMASTNGAIGGWNYGDYTTLSTPSGEGNFPYWMMHEYVGHTLSNLPDFYVTGGCKNPDFARMKTDPEAIAYDPELNKYYAKYYTNGQSTEAAYNNLKNEWKKGYRWSGDFTDIPGETVWSYFVGKPGYSDVGPAYTDETQNTIKNKYDINFGQDELCGLCSPQSEDAMRANPFTCFTVGTRLWIWNRVLSRAGEPDPNYFDGDDNNDGARAFANFVQWEKDKGYNNNFDGNSNYCKTVINLPEVFTDKYWKDNDLYPERSDNTTDPAYGF
ncbi:MAG: BACON domain-containing protein [Prevotellaceae bacterium]|nr:BACON domain-containing protein [Prevotellaceae bacterium]